MSNNRIVWSDEHGDLRKKKDEAPSDSPVQEQKIVLLLRRLTAGKGRAVVEISGLPHNKKWCEELAKDLKKSLGVGGAFKSNYIEIHTEAFDKVTAKLDAKKLKWKKTGG